MQRLSLVDVESLLEAPSPAVLATYRSDGSTLLSPVWYRWTGDAFEIVIAEGDVKLGHLARDPRCVFLVFEATPPFRGVEMQARADLQRGDVSAVRRAISSRYLGQKRADEFVSQRSDKPGVLLRIHPDRLRVWDLSSILPKSRAGDSPPISSDHTSTAHALPGGSRP